MKTTDEARSASNNELATAIDAALKKYYQDNAEPPPVRSVTISFGFADDTSPEDTKMGVTTVVTPPLKEGDYSAAVPLLAALGRFVYAITGSGDEGPQAAGKVTLN